MKNELTKVNTLLPEPTPRHCSNCAKEFFGPAVLDAKNTFCSKECESIFGAKEHAPPAAAAAIAAFESPTPGSPATCHSCRRAIDREISFIFEPGPDQADVYFCSLKCMENYVVGRNVAFKSAEQSKDGAVRFVIATANPPRPVFDREPSADELKVTAIAIAAARVIREWKLLTDKGRGDIERAFPRIASAAKLLADVAAQK